jgi:NADH-quinone oxidoreductase subunit A
MSFLAAMDSYAFGSYLPILILIAFSLLLSGGMVAASRYVGRRIKYPSKFTPYESGMEPTGNARERFSVKFYLVAILFILFDIEVVFLYPWAVRFSKLGLFGLVEMFIFLAILLVGYFYIIGTGALDWDERGLMTKEEENE